MQINKSVEKRKAYLVIAGSTYLHNSSSHRRLIQFIAFDPDGQSCDNQKYFYIYDVVG